MPMVVKARFPTEVFLTSATIIAYHTKNGAKELALSMK